jgi:hypothetical protein
MTDPIRIPNVAVFDGGNGTTYRQITSYAEVTPEIARQIVAAVVPEDMHRLCLELDKAKFMARLEALEGRTSAIAEIQRDDHEKGMAGRISALEARLLAQEIWSQAPAPVDAGPVTFAPGWHCPHCNTDIPGGQYHDCKEEKRQETDAEDRSCGLTPPADDAAVEELRCWSVGYEYYHEAYFSDDAPLADQRPTAESLAESLQHGARLVPRAIQAKDAEIAALRAEVERLTKLEAAYEIADRQASGAQVQRLDGPALVAK